MPPELTRKQADESLLIALQAGLSTDEIVRKILSDRSCETVGQLASLGLNKATRALVQDGHMWRQAASKLARMASDDVFDYRYGLFVFGAFGNTNGVKEFQKRCRMFFICQKIQELPAPDKTRLRQLRDRASFQSIRPATTGRQKADRLFQVYELVHQCTDVDHQNYAQHIQSSVQEYHRLLPTMDDKIHFTLEGLAHIINNRFPSDRVNDMTETYFAGCMDALFRGTNGGVGSDDHKVWINVIEKVPCMYGYALYRGNAPLSDRRRTTNYKTAIKDLLSALGRGMEFMLIMSDAMKVRVVNKRSVHRRVQSKEVSDYTRTVQEYRSFLQPRTRVFQGAMKKMRVFHTFLIRRIFNNDARREITTDMTYIAPKNALVLLKKHPTLMKLFSYSSIDNRLGDKITDLIKQVAVGPRGLTPYAEFVNSMMLTRFLRRHNVPHQYDHDSKLVAV